jgi:hypothetical protein
LRDTVDACYGYFLDLSTIEYHILVACTTPATLPLRTYQSRARFLHTTTNTGHVHLYGYGANERFPITFSLLVLVHLPEVEETASHKSYKRTSREKMPLLSLNHARQSSKSGLIGVDKMTLTSISQNV